MSKIIMRLVAMTMTMTMTMMMMLPTLTGGFTAVSPLLSSRNKIRQTPLRSFPRYISRKIIVIAMANDKRDNDNYEDKCASPSEEPLKDPFSVDAASFFAFAGVNFDPFTFLSERNDTGEPVYSIIGSVGERRGGESTRPVRIFWTTTTKVTQQHTDVKDVLQAFEGRIATLWIDDNCDSSYSASGNDCGTAGRRTMIQKPSELKSALEASNEVMVVIEDQRGDAWINPNAIDESSVQEKILLNREGLTHHIFCAKQKKLSSPPRPLSDNQNLIYWATLKDDGNPYGIISNAWTHDQLQIILGSDKAVAFPRKIALDLKGFAATTSLRVLKKRRIVTVAFLAGWWLLDWGLDWKKIPTDMLYGATTGIIRNRAFVLSQVIFLPCAAGAALILGRALKPLKEKSLLVESLTTLSIVMDFVGILERMFLDNIVSVLVKLPIVVSQKVSSMITSGWSKYFNGVVELLPSQTIPRTYQGPIESCNSSGYPLWVEAIFLAPVREEFFFRFVFDKVWHGVLGALGGLGVANVAIVDQGNWMRWTSSLLFGLNHVSNWFPIQHSQISDDDDDTNWDGNLSAYKNVLGAVFQSANCFLAAFFLYNPLYAKRGLSASIGAHAALNATAMGLSIFISKL